MGIGNIGWSEFIVILALALIFFGPRRLPEIAATLGRGLREFRKALNEVKSEIAQAGTESTDFTPRIAPRPAERATIGGPQTAADVIDAPEPARAAQDAESAEPESPEPDPEPEIAPGAEPTDAKAGDTDGKQNSAG